MTLSTVALLQVHHVDLLHKTSSAVTEKDFTHLRKATDLLLWLTKFTAPGPLASAKKVLSALLAVAGIKKSFQAATDPSANQIMCMQIQYTVTLLLSGHNQE